MSLSSDAKICTCCKEEKDLAKFGIRKASVDGLTPLCKACKSGKDKEYRLRNADKCRAISKQYREKNKEEISKDAANRYAKNKKEYKIKAKHWANKNPEKRLQINKKYREKNRHKVVKWACESRAKRLKRRPAWGQNGISEIYALAEWLNNATRGYSGRGKFQSWHVDHVLPLCGKRVSGLHVFLNLQVIPASDNLSKRNDA